MHSVTANKNLFLPVKWKVVAVFAHQDVRQQSGRSQSTLLQTFRQRRDERGAVQINAVNIFSANGSAAQKARRLEVQLLADFLADAAPALRCGLHRFGINDFLHHRQVVRQARRALFAGTNDGGLGFFDNGEGIVRGHKGWQLQEQFQLRSIQSLTARSKHPPHQPINLLPQQIVLPTTLRQGLAAFSQLASEFFFAQRHSLHSIRATAQEVSNFLKFLFSFPAHTKVAVSLRVNPLHRSTSPAPAASASTSLPAVPDAWATKMFPAPNACSIPTIPCHPSTVFLSACAAGC